MILFTRTILGEAEFAAWGWRIPFLLSVVLLGVSVWIRLQLNESPVFQKMKDEGKGSKAPLTEAFANWSNAKIVIIALFGGVMGQGVVWYTGQFYALFFLQSILKVDGYTANLLIAWSLLFGTGFFVVFGALSDKIGRKPIILAGCLIAALTFFPIFRHDHHQRQPGAGEGDRDRQGRGGRRSRGLRRSVQPGRHPRLHRAMRHRPRLPVAVLGQVLDRLRRGRLRREGRRQRQGSCLRRRQDLQPGGAGGGSGGRLPEGRRRRHRQDVDTRSISSGRRSRRSIGLLFVLVLFVTMVYGPIAAMLVELFPTKIRYTSMSLPYHIGNGWFGGLLPATAFAIVASTGDIYAGLWYPIIFASITAVVGFFFLPETKDVDITK